MILSWSYPALSKAGGNLDGIDRLVVYRYTEVLPETIAARHQRGELDLSSGEPESIALFDVVPLVPEAQFRKLATRIGTLEHEAIPSYTTGALVVVEERPPLTGERGEPIRYTYGVSTVTRGTESDISNLVTIVPLDVPAAPRDLEVQGVAAGAIVSWSPPDQTVLGSADPHPAGYRVYRFPTGFGAYGSAGPAMVVGGDQLSVTDPAPPGEWKYAVTALAWENDAVVQESSLSLVRTAELTDLAPPAAPAQVTPLVEQTVVRLIWTAVTAPDLAGFRIFRRPSGGEPERLADLDRDAEEYVDETARPGVEYVYSVAAFDEAGNESPRTETGTVLVRR